MNIVDYLVLAILVFSIMAGMYKGFASSGLSLVGFFGAWFGARALYGKVANLALSNTTLMAVLNQYLEPETFFESRMQASMSVNEVVAGGESAIKAAVENVGEKISVIASAFEANIRNQAFIKLNIESLSDYLDQTIWQAVFNVIAFLVTFVILYIIVKLVINLIDRIMKLPVLRMFDWLLGGLCGFIRGFVVAVLILCILPSVISLLDADLTQKLFGESTLYNIVSTLDFMNVAGLVKKLIS